MSLSLLQSYESDSSEDEEDRLATKVEASTTPHPPKSSSTVVAKSLSPSGHVNTKSKENQAFDALQQSAGQNRCEIPADLARELKAAGYNASDIHVQDIDPAPISNQPHPSAHIPQQALRNSAMRLARHITKESVSSVARRKHQITALAAEAVALQVAQDALPGSAPPRSRTTGKFE